MSEPPFESLIDIGTPGEATAPATPTWPHNQYCIDDWEAYHGDGPRGMGPAGDGCVCVLAPGEGE